MRIAVFASGGGSNFQAILDASRSGELQADVVLCVASRPEAGVISRAERNDIPVHVLGGSIQQELGNLIEVLAAHEVDFIALAGFMKMIPLDLIRAFPNRIVNIHPALLPAFGGKGMYGSHVHVAVIKSGVTESGASVHLVDEHYDTGPVVLQETVPVLKNDTPEALASRVLEIEHQLYPKALNLFAKGHVHVHGRTISIQRSR